MADEPGEPAKGSWKNLSSLKSELGWDPDDIPGSLKRANAYAEEHAASAIEWYNRKKAHKARFSRLFRYGAILCTALAGLLPIVAGAWPNFGASLSSLRPTNGNLVVSLLVGLAASLIAIDRFGGFSTGWIRYVRTGAEIHKLLHEYRLDWLKLIAEANISGSLQPANMLIRTREFVVAVQGLVIQETDAWVTEFESNLSQMEKSAKEQSDKQLQELQAKLDRAQPGSLFITVSNSHDLDAGKFKVLLFNNTEKVAEAADQTDTWQQLGLSAGLYTVSVSAAIDGKPVSKTLGITIETGKPKHETVELKKAAGANA